MDTHVLGRGPNRSHPDRRQRAQPATTRSCRACPICRQPRPAVQRAAGDGARCRGFLARNRSHGRPAPHARRSGRGFRGRDRHHPRPVGSRQPAIGAIPRGVLPGVGCPTGTRARARHPDLDRGRQTPNAPAHWPQGRGLAAVTRLHATRRPRSRKRDHRRSRAQGWTRPTGNSPYRQHRRGILLRAHRVPERHEPALGR